jgi:hypothetical protein
MSNEQFENWKEKFIISNFADNIYFQKFIKDLAIKNNRKLEPFGPELNIWTDQPINALKTQNHL